MEVFSYTINHDLQRTSIDTRARHYFQFSWMHDHQCMCLWPCLAKIGDDIVTASALTQMINHDLYTDSS